MVRTMVVAALFACIGSGVWAQELKKLSLDDASILGLKIETDKQVKVEGQASVKITTSWPTVVCLGEVKDLDVENAKLLYKARVKSEMEGQTYLEMRVHVGGGQFFSRGMTGAVSGKSDWKQIQTPFVFERGQKPEKVTLNVVINGTGTVWVDDVILSKEAK